MPKGEGQNCVLAGGTMRREAVTLGIGDREYSNHFIKHANVNMVQDKKAITN